jgi:hypothetical protein
MFQFRVGRYSSRVDKYLRIVNSGVSNFISEKSKRFTLTAVVKSNGRKIGFRLTKCSFRVRLHKKTNTP